MAEEEDKKPEKKVNEEDVELNLNDPEDFVKALGKEVPRPFTFGPIEFTELNVSEKQSPFDIDAQKQRIEECLGEFMSQPSCCIRGQEIEVKGRRFKRRSTMLKHGRFMQNLQVMPIFPKIVEAAEKSDEEDNIDRQGSEDD